MSVSRTAISLDTDSISSSFGGGFELMKAGRDNDGIWALMESGLQYVTVPRASPTHLRPFLSISAIVSHVPYVMRFITSAMGRSGTLQRAIDFGRGSVLKRLEIGANRKDLFYYLVRQRIIFLTYSDFIMPITERRRASRNRATLFR